MGKAEGINVHQLQYSSILFRKLQSIISFCVPTCSVSVLRWISAISQYNRCPLMYEVRGKQWNYKYFIFEKLSYQDHREVPDTYKPMSCTKSLLRIPCSIKWNTSSFTIFYYIIQYKKKCHACITMVDQSHNIQ